MGNVYARVGEDKLARGHGHGASEQHALADYPVILEEEWRLPVDVEQQRVFEHLAREQAFGQSGEEDDVEAAAAGFVDGSDED